jgi:hypothetical protein
MEATQPGPNAYYLSDVPRRFNAPRLSLGTSAVLLGRLGISVRPSTKALLEKRAAEEGRSVTNYLENLIVRNGEKKSSRRRPELGFGEDWKSEMADFIGLNDRKSCQQHCTEVRCQRSRISELSLR